MQKILYGFFAGVGIEVICYFLFFRVETLPLFVHGYIDPKPYIFFYPAVFCLVAGNYLILSKKEYLAGWGVFFGFLASCATVATLFGMG
jgi:hypothetical protein